MGGIGWEGRMGGDRVGRIKIGIEWEGGIGDRRGGGYKIKQECLGV